MNNLRLFYQKKLSNDLIGNLDKKQSHYVNKVMRLKENDEFNIFNDSGEWVAQIKKINREGIEFQIIKQIRSKESRIDIWLAFSPIKSNYFNFMIQKATELGVTKFIPIIFERSIVRKINNERLKKIIIEATEQSNRILLPSLESPIKLNDFLKIYQDKIKLILTDINSNKKKLSISKSEKKPLCLVVGPEGDFSESERLKILTFKDLETVKLNDNILRSETAVISAISVINYLIN